MPEPLRQRSFAIRYITLTAGETFSKVCVMAAFAYLTHVLSPAEYGIIELALSITVFFVLGVESGMGLYGARIIAAHPERATRLVPQVMLVRAILAGPAFGLVLLVAWRYQAYGLGILAVNGLAILLTPFLTQWVFQGLRQMHFVAAGTALRNLTFVALVLALVRPGSDIRLVAFAEVAGVVVLALVNTWLLSRYIRLRLDWTGVGAGARSVFREVWFMGLSDFTWACLWYAPVLITGWILGPDGVAWIAAPVRVVLALHTFVFLYFFNLLPNLAKELVQGVAAWRVLVRRSITISMGPSILLAVGGTITAPWVIPAVFGEAYRPAIVPFQIAIWMIPVAWFSGHFRFSLIAAGQQRWEFAVSVATAAVTVSLAVGLVGRYGPAGAASALVAGGFVNTAMAMWASHLYVGPITRGRSRIPQIPPGSTP